MVPQFYFYFNDGGCDTTNWVGAELTESFGGGYLLDRLDGMSEELILQHIRKDKDQLKTCFLLHIALMFGTAGLPHVIIRFFTVPNVRDARRSSSYALIFIAILYVDQAVAAFAKNKSIILSTTSNIAKSRMVYQMGSN